LALFIGYKAGRLGSRKAKSLLSNRAASHIFQLSSIIAVIIKIPGLKATGFKMYQHAI